VVHGWLEARKKTGAVVRTSIVDEFDHTSE